MSVRSNWLALSRQQLSRVKSSREVRVNMSEEGICYCAMNAWYETFVDKERNPTVQNG